MSARYYLKVAIIGTFDAMVCRRMWGDIGNGILAILVLLLRLLILVTFPVSQPVIAWLLWKSDKFNRERLDEARARLRARMNSNIP